MTKYIVPAVSFIAGSCFGVLAMCCLSANRLDKDDWDEDDDDWDEGVMGLAAKNIEKFREYERIKAREYRARKKLQATT